MRSGTRFLRAAQYVSYALALLVPAGGTRASSHREAPLIALDPAADATDLYLFRSPADDAAGADTVTIIANYFPMLGPGGGPTFARFSDDVLYEIKLDNDGDAKEDITYAIQFKTAVTTAKEGVLYNRGPIAAPDDENLALVQRATVVRIDKQGRTEQTDVPVAPAYVGRASYPAAAGHSSEEAYEKVAEAALTSLSTSGGGSIFLGPRDDPYFADLGATFDLLQIRGADGGQAARAAAPGIDTFAGQNVLSIALQIPIAALTRDGARSPEHGKSAVLGAWTAASRPRSVTLKPGKSPSGTGWQQVGRLGLPLINELLVPILGKDLYNSATPREDAKKLVELLKNPELAKVLGILYRLHVPAAGRTDLINLISWKLGSAPLDVAGIAPADILRVDLSVLPSPMAAAQTGRLGLLSGDAAGFPNGRRLTDDVLDIMERMIVGALCVKDQSCSTDANVTPLGDGVDQNDRPFLHHFPYLAPPEPQRIK